MQQFDITILTDSRYLGTRQSAPYIQNIIQEDQLVQSALEKRDLKVRRINWDHPEVDWSDTRYILFRSTWDYFGGTLHPYDASEQEIAFAEKVVSHYEQQPF